MSFSKLQPHLCIHSPLQSWTTELRSAIADQDASFSSLLTDFLEGSGVPCPQLFEDAKIHFDPIVDLETINNDGFRSRIFCWVSSGSCDRQTDAPRITVSFLCFNDKTIPQHVFQVRFVADNDPSYGEN